MPSMSFKLFAAATLIAGIGLGAPVHATSKGDLELATPKAAMSYGQLVRETRRLKSDAERIAHDLVGRRVRLKLKPSSQGRGEFYVNKVDQIGFVCKSTERDFKGGTVGALIVQYEAGADDGEFFTRDRCGTAKQRTPSWLARRATPTLFTQPTVSRT